MRLLTDEFDRFFLAKLVLGCGVFASLVTLLHALLALTTGVGPARLAAAEVAAGEAFVAAVTASIGALLFRAVERARVRHTGE